MRKNMRKIKKRLSKKSANKCHYCGVQNKRKDMTVDHKTPLSKGGKNTGSNYVLACFDCNQKKGDMDYDEYMEMIRRGDE